MPINNTDIRINKSASNNSKYAAKSSLNFSHFIYFIFQKKRREGAQPPSNPSKKRREGAQPLV